MATGKQISVGDTATELHTAADNAGALVHVFNAGGNPVQLGGSGVTFGSGFEIAASGSSADETKVTLRAGEALYGIAGSGLTSTVHVLVIGE